MKILCALLLLLLFLAPAHSLVIHFPNFFKQAQNSAKDKMKDVIAHAVDGAVDEVIGESFFPSNDAASVDNDKNERDIQDDAFDCAFSLHNIFE